MLKADMQNPGPGPKSVIRNVLDFILRMVGLVFLILLLLAWLFHVLELADDPIRSRVGRAKGDMRSIAIALESYHSDHHAYPAWSLNQQNLNGAFDRQPTFAIPNADFLPLGRPGSSFYSPMDHFHDPFIKADANAFSYYAINDPGNPSKSGWILWSAGPDLDHDLTIDNIKTVYDPIDIPAFLQRINSHSYDPTNGSNSNGDVWHIKH